MQWTSAAVTDGDLERLLDGLEARLEQELGPGGADVVLAFVARAHRGGVEQVARRLGARYAAPVVGCAAAGVIGGEKEHEGVPAVAALVGRLPRAVAQPFVVEARDLPDPDAPPRAWHEALGLSPVERPSFLLFADPFTFPAERLLEGVDYAWPGSAVVGGLASGGRGPGDQTLLAGDRVVREGAVGVALMGDVALTPVLAQGGRPLGPARTVSACEGRLLRALDGQPALEVLRATLRDASPAERPGRGQPVLIGVDAGPLVAAGGDGWLLRPLVGVDPRANGLLVGEVLRPGRRVRFHVRDRAASQDDLRRVLAAIDEGSSREVAAALLVSCLGRGAGLFGRPDHDLSALRARLPGVAVGGFFAQGEFGPMGGQHHVHAFTSAIGLVGPRRAPPA